MGIFSFSTHGKRTVLFQRLYGIVKRHTKLLPESHRNQGIIHIVAAHHRQFDFACLSAVINKFLSGFGHRKIRRPHLAVRFGSIITDRTFGLAQ